MEFCVAQDRILVLVLPDPEAPSVDISLVADKPIVGGLERSDCMMLPNFPLTYPC